MKRTAIRTYIFFIGAMIYCVSTIIVAFEAPREERFEREKIELEKNQEDIEKKRQEVEKLREKTEKNKEDIQEEQKVTQELNILLEKQIKAQEEFGNEFAKEKEEAQKIAQELTLEQEKIKKRIESLAQELSGQKIDIGQQREHEVTVPLSVSKRFAKRLEAFFKDVQARGYELINNREKAKAIRQNLVDIYTALDADPKTILTNTNRLRRLLVDRNERLKNDAYALNVYLQQVEKVFDMLQNAKTYEEKKAAINKKKQIELNMLRDAVFPMSSEIIEVVQFLKNNETQFSDAPSKALIEKITSLSESLLRNLINENRPWEYLMTPEEYVQASREAEFAAQQFKTKDLALFQATLEKLLGDGSAESPFVKNFEKVIKSRDYKIIMGDIAKLEMWYKASDNPEQKVWIADIIANAYSKIYEAMDKAQQQVSDSKLLVKRLEEKITLQIKKELWQKLQEETKQQAAQEKPATKKAITTLELENRDATINKDALVKQADDVLKTRQSILTMLRGTEPLNISTLKRLATALEGQTTDFVNTIQQSDASNVAQDILNIVLDGYGDISNGLKQYVIAHDGWSALSPDAGETLIQVYANAINRISELTYQLNSINSDLTVVVNGEIRILQQMKRDNALAQKAQEKVMKMNKEVADQIAIVRDLGSPARAPRKVVYNPKDRKVWEAVIASAPLPSESGEKSDEPGTYDV